MVAGLKETQTLVLHPMCWFWEQQPSLLQSVTGTTPVPTASASVSTQVEPEEPEADQHQQLQFQQPSISVLCKCLSQLATPALTQFLPLVLCFWWV